MIVSAPTTATIGGSGTIDVSWSSLVAGKRYLGAVGYSDGSSLIGRTLVSVSTK